MLPIESSLPINMETTTAENPVTHKTRELCQSLLDDTQFQDARRRIEAFMGDDQAKSQYQLLTERGEYLQHKQQQGLPLAGEEITEFEKLREEFMNNPVSKGFLDAQQEVHRIQESVAQYVSKTFELGRVPAETDFEGGSCGHGCGCH